MRFTALLVALLVVGLLRVPAAAEKREETQLREKERALSQAQKQLKEEKAKAASARRREASLLAELEAIDRALAEKKRQLVRLDRRLKEAKGEVTTLQREIQGLEQRQAGRQVALARWLRAFYKLRAGGGVLPLILSGEDPVARAVQLRHLATLAAVDARLVQEYRDIGERLADRRDRVESRKRELSALRGQASQEQAQVDREAARRRKLLAKVQEQRAYHERMVGELSEASRQLRALIRELRAKQRDLARLGSAPGAVRPGAGFGSRRGRLPWPTEGAIVTAFGPQVHPRFGTRTFRSGIDIEAQEGTEIQAVYAGQVIYADWFKGYGHLIILDHGNDYYTLYAHAAEIRVKEREQVRQGQVIGTVGDTGSLAGPRLYFEVRYQGRPENPAKWLRRPS
ncbi:MAG: murein hydrolase activator EnvC family protein [Candidatus Methylomirabilia bacterium]